MDAILAHCTENKAGPRYRKVKECNARTVQKKRQDHVIGRLRNAMLAHCTENKAGPRYRKVKECNARTLYR